MLLLHLQLLGSNYSLRNREPAAGHGNMTSRKAASPISKQGNLKDGSQVQESRLSGKSKMMRQVQDQAEMASCRSGLHAVTVARVMHSSVIVRQVHSDIEGPRL